MIKENFRFALSRASIAVLVTSLAACSTTSSNGKSNQLVAKRYTNRQIAQAPTTTVPIPYGDQDYTAQYPTLSTLCLAALKPGYGGGLSLGTAVLSPYEVATIGLKCHSGTYQGKQIVNFDPTAYKTIVSGVSTWQQDMKGWQTLVLGTVNGKTTADLVFESNDVGTMVEHLILNLNSSGQPVNTLDHFSGTVDPQSIAASGEDATQYTSGFYIHQSANDSLNNCVLLSSTSDGPDAPTCLANFKSSSSDTKTALPVGDQFMGGFTLGLGWLANMSPTNTHLDGFPGSRVDFQKAMSELQAFLKSQNNDPSFDVNGAIAEAKKAIQSAASNN